MSLAIPQLYMRMVYLICLLIISTGIHFWSQGLEGYMLHNAPDLREAPKDVQLVKLERVSKPNDFD